MRGPTCIRVEAVDKYTVRFVNATPDVTLEGRLSRYGSDIMSRRGWEEAASYLDWARKADYDRSLQGGRVAPGRVADA